MLAWSQIEMTINSIGASSVALMGSTNAYPATLPDAAFYLSYLTVPQDSAIHDWKNQVGAMETFTNKSAGSLTNTASGMFFDGVTGSCLTNGASPTLWNPTNDSVWFCVKMNSFAGGYDALLRGANATYGLSASGPGSSSSFVLYFGLGQFYFGKEIVTNQQYDVVLMPATNAYCVTGYTNGSGGFINGATPPYRGTGELLRAIGNGQNGNFHGYVKFILICTNRAFTAGDIAGLHNYALTH